MTPWTSSEENILRTASSREQAYRTLRLEGFNRTMASIYRKITAMKRTTQ
jgi:propanediol dehydratase small subunit